MSPTGLQRSSGNVQLTSARPSTADSWRTLDYVGVVPNPDIRLYDGVVLCIEGRPAMERIQVASCGRPSVREPEPRLSAISRAAARIRCALRGLPHWQLPTSSIFKMDMRKGQAALVALTGTSTMPLHSDADNQVRRRSLHFRLWHAPDATVYAGMLRG